MSRNQHLTDAEHAALNLPVRMSYECFKSGKGTNNDYRTLVHACNITLICAESIDALVEAACQDARDALLRSRTRFDKTSRWGFDGPAIATVAEMLDVYDQLTRLLKPIQLQNAINEARAREQRGHGIQALEHA